MIAPIGWIIDDLCTTILDASPEELAELQPKLIALASAIEARPSRMILLRELEEELSKMRPHSPSFKLIKAEMKRRGHWKNLPRGKSFETKDSRRAPR